MAELGEYPGQLLHQAAIWNNVDLLTSLLEGEEAQNINAQDSFGRTPLFTSVSNGNYECMKLFLSNGGKYAQHKEN